MAFTKRGSERPHFLILLYRQLSIFDEDTFKNHTTYISVKFLCFLSFFSTLSSVFVLCIQDF
jgi:hypothetical protein